MLCASAPDHVEFSFDHTFCAKSAAVPAMSRCNNWSIICRLVPRPSTSEVPKTERTNERQARTSGGTNLLSDSAPMHSQEEIPQSKPIYLGPTLNPKPLGLQGFRVEGWCRAIWAFGSRRLLGVGVLPDTSIAQHPYNPGLGFKVACGGMKWHKFWELQGILLLKTPTLHIRLSGLGLLSGLL